MNYIFKIKGVYYAYSRRKMSFIEALATAIKKSGISRVSGITII